MIKICVTGNKGFIGKALQIELEKQGYIVVGIEKWVFMRDTWQKSYQEYLEGIKPDAVFHVGACSDTQNQDATEMLKLNTLSTYIVADYCQKNNVPLIFSSSASVYGSKGHPETLYAWSKYLAELYCIKMGGVALRYFNVYGHYELDKGKMASVACQAYSKWKFGERMKLFPQRPTRDFVYIKDVVAANIYAWDNYENLKGKAYDVGSGQSRAFEEVMNIMEIMFDYLPDESIPSNYQFITKADPEKFMEGWEPKYQIEEGLREYLAELKVTTIQPY
jgi:ADP-L-glycero-D-manno-heptose 6-epimerase